MKTSPLPLRIAITCTLTDKRLEVEVANTGEWVRKKEYSRNENGIGLKNLRQRLELLYPGYSSLTLDTREGWIIAKVKLPLSGADADAH